MYRATFVLFLICFSSLSLKAYQYYDCTSPIADLPIFNDGDYSHEMRINIDTWYNPPSVEIIQNNGRKNNLKFSEKRGDGTYVFKSEDGLDPLLETPGLTMEISDAMVNLWGESGPVELTRDLGDGYLIGYQVQCE